MPKRSTNFNPGKKPLATPSRILDLMRWVGMSDEDIKKALEDEKRRQESKR